MSKALITRGITAREIPNLIGIEALYTRKAIAKLPAFLFTLFSSLKNLIIF